MAKKSTKNKANKGKKLSNTTLIILFIVAVVCYLLYEHYLAKYEQQPDVATTEEVAQSSETQEPTVSKSEPEKKGSSDNVSTTAPDDVTLNYKVTQPLAVADNQIIKHKSFTLSYNEKHEQADWVYYLLTKKMINGNVERTDDFREDESISTGSAIKADYTRSGYDRGHLCPSADVRHDLEAQSETFFMSNMSPQAPGFNRGVWKELEEQIRDYTLKHDSVYIVTGPVLTDGLKTIGKTNKVSVPEYYYKVLYSKKDGGQMIGYLMKNEGLDGEPNDYIVPIDEIEKMSGLDFFPEIQGEESLEGKKGDINWWAK
jgi:endonuclease G